MRRGCVGVLLIGMPGRNIGEVLKSLSDIPRRKDSGGLRTIFPRDKPETLKNTAKARLLCDMNGRFRMQDHCLVSIPREFRCVARF